jgi:hypothetical protein
MDGQEIETKIKQEISAGRMAADVQALIANSPRHAATENEWKAAEYVRGQFQATGLDVRVDQVPGIRAWHHHDTRVKIVEPIERELNGVAILGSGATPPEGVVAELRYVGQGKMEDYEGIDFQNTFVMRDPPRALTLDNASDETAPQGPTDMLIKRGVAGFIEHSRLKGNILQTDLLSGPGGMSVPAVAVTYEDGQLLKELLREWYATPSWYKRTEASIPVKLKVTVDASSQESYGLNVIARAAGGEKPEKKWFWWLTTIMPLVPARAITPLRWRSTWKCAASFPSCRSRSAPSSSSRSPPKNTARPARAPTWKNTSSRTPPPTKLPSCWTSSATAITCTTSPNRSAWGNWSRIHPKSIALSSGFATTWAT